jgi:hypothetical protein
MLISTQRQKLIHAIVYCASHTSYCGKLKLFKFDDGPFTKRELRLISELATRFESELTKPLVSFTHEELGPWSKIWDNGRGKNERIPYTLAVPDAQPDREEILAAAAEYESIAAADAQPH